MKEKITEVELAKKVIKYLENLKWDIYQEVQMHRSGRCCDIVAAQNNIVWAIECKTSCGLKVIEQAYKWIGYANLVSVAVPTTGFMARKVCKTYGIGVLRTGKKRYGKCEELIRPHIFRKRHNHLKNVLNEKDRIFNEAGSTSSAKWSPFKQTCAEVLRVVTINPGIKLKDLIEKIDHHYTSDSSAKQSLSHWIDKGLVKGVYKKRSGKYVTLYPKRSRKG